MAEFSQADWTQFQVQGNPNAYRAWNNQCRGLGTVWHVTHVQTGIEIVRGGQLTPQLIYDESRLNTERILVVWLSPNDWTNAGGFRYGNVAFQLDWPALIE